MGVDSGLGRDEPTEIQFDFGRNWDRFSRRALDEERVAQARADFSSLLEGVELVNRTFFDIGFGQGLSLLSAASLGARVAGCDINKTCAEVLRKNAAWFSEVSAQDIPLVVGSILDARTQAEIHDLAMDGFDVVHAWGVLHHTGDLWRALQVAAELVAPRGVLVIAIYNRHWSSPVWRWIKWLYVRAPGVGRRMLVAGFYPIIWAAKLMVTGKSPMRQERGMDFYHDVVDWVGGYPYEYATAAEVKAVAKESGFECLRFRPPRVPTGCNEFVFRKTGAR